MKKTTQNYNFFNITNIIKNKKIKNIYILIIN